MLNKLLYKLTGGLPCKIIKTDNSPYMERYYLGSLLGITFYLHRFLSGDKEKHIHNHPWYWAGSSILTGGYVEEVSIDIYRYGCITEYVKRNWFNWVKSNTFHRIESVKPNTWTLFFHGSKAYVDGHLKGWGVMEHRYVLGLHDVVVFISRPSTNSNWWKTALKGANSERSPL